MSRSITRERPHRDAVDCLIARGLIPSPEDLPLLTGQPCTCEDESKCAGDE